MASPAESPVSVADNGGFVAAVASTLPHSAVCDDAKTADAFVPASGLTVEIADAINHEVPATSEHISTSLSQEQSSLAQQHPQTPRPWAGAAAAAVAEAAAALAAHEAARTESRASALKELMEGRVTDRLQKFLEQKSGKSPSMGALSSPASAAMPVIGFAGSGGVDLRFAPRTLAGTAAGGSGADSNDADGSPQASPRVSFFDSESLPRSAPAIPPMPFSSSFSAPSLFSPSGRDRGTALKLISFADLSASKARADSAGIQAEPDAADRSSLSAAEDSVIAAALIRANSRPTLVVSASHSSSPVLSPDDTGFLRLPTPQLQYPPALQRKLSAATSPAPLVLSPWSSSKSDIAAPTASLTLTLPSTPNRAANAATAVEAYTLAQVLRTIPAPARFVQSELRAVYSLLLHRWRGRRETATSLTSAFASATGDLSIGEDVIGNQAASNDATNVQARLLCEALVEFVCSSNAAFEERLERYVELNPNTIVSHASVASPTEASPSHVAAASVLSPSSTVLASAMPSPASSSLSSANGRDPTGIVRQLRHRMQRLDLSASVAHTARVLCMMQLASAVGGGEQSKEHLVCDEFVFCSNFGLLYDDACTAQQQRSIQPHGQIEAKKGAGDCVLM